MLTCPHCKKEFEFYEETVIKNAADKYMIKAACPHCDKWIKWLRFTESNSLTLQQIQDMYKHNEALR